MNWYSKLIDWLFIISTTSHTTGPSNLYSYHVCHLIVWKIRIFFNFKHNDAKEQSDCNWASSKTLTSCGCYFYNLQRRMRNSNVGSGTTGQGCSAEFLGIQPTSLSPPSIPHPITHSQEMRIQTTRVSVCWGTFCKPVPCYFLSWCSHTVTRGETERLWEERQQQQTAGVFVLFRIYPVSHHPPTFVLINFVRRFNKTETKITNV